MAKTHNLGFPRIGTRRELKFGLESFWNAKIDTDELNALGAALRRQNWSRQAHLDLLPVGDFSFYDQVLDMSFTLGNVPQRVRQKKVGRSTCISAWPVAARLGTAIVRVSMPVR